ncbi:MAG TPA: triacylglycerol lipase [Pseudomonadales bacterium]|nr:triacylglycerol lipase [Pseudomonadales bacterium]
MKTLLLKAGAVLFSAGLATNAMASTSDYAKTRYPIVFAHGVFGFDKLGPVDYWYGIPQDLRANGAEVFVTQVSPFNSSEVRGEQFLRQVEDILAITGAEKVNIIGHSQGAQTVRYAANVAPDKIASATTVGGDNFGTPVVDFVYGIQQSPSMGKAFTVIMNFLTGAYNSLLQLQHGTTYPRNAEAALKTLSTPGALAFNALYPAGLPKNKCDEGDYEANGVHFYSWNGGSPFTSPLDPADYVFTLTALFFKGESSDGLVGRCESHFGKVIRDDFKMNHLDEINHFFGLVGNGKPSPKEIFREHANRLKLENL